MNFRSCTLPLRRLNKKKKGGERGSVDLIEFTFDLGPGFECVLARRQLELIKTEKKGAMGTLLRRGKKKPRNKNIGKASACVRQGDMVSPFKQELESPSITFIRTGCGSFRCLLWFVFCSISWGARPRHARGIFGFDKVGAFVNANFISYKRTKKEGMALSNNPAWWCR